MTTPPRDPDLDYHVRRSGDDYADAFLKLLPSGQAWPKTPDSTLESVTAGLARYWGTVDARAADLLEQESDPRKTIEILSDWERAWGLPDPCLQEPQTIAERQRVLVQRMTLLGAQSRNWFKEVASWVGYDDITIDEFSPWIVGISRCGWTKDDDADLVHDQQSISFDGSVTSGWFKVVHTSREVESDQINYNATAADVLAALEAMPSIGAGDVVCDGGPLPDAINITFIGAQSYMRQPTLTAGTNYLEGTRDLPTGGTGQPIPVFTHITVGSGRHNKWEIAAPEIRFYWRVHVDQAKLTWFRCGSGQCGVDPHLYIGLATDLECLFLRWQPAQTQIVFDYSGLSAGGSMSGTP